MKLIKKISLFFLTMIFLLGLTGFIEANTNTNFTIENPLEHDTIGQLLESIANSITTVVGAIAVIMFIIAGVLFVTSAGNPDQVTKAKSFLKYAIIGFIIALIASTLVQVVEWVLGV